MFAHTRPTALLLSVAQARASLRLADAALLPSANVSVQGARAYQSLETPLGQVLDAAANARNTNSNGYSALQ